MVTLIIIIITASLIKVFKSLRHLTVNYESIMTQQKKEVVCTYLDKHGGINEFVYI